MKPYELVLTTRVQRDIASTIEWSQKRFGSLAAERYNSLIRSALRRVATDPHDPLIKERGPGAPGYFSLHLRHIPGQVKHPRHLLAFTIDEDQRLVSVIRLLHEAMDFELQLEGTLPEDG